MAEFKAYRAAKFAKTTTSNEMHILNRFMAFIGEDIQMRHLRPEHVTDWFYGEAGIMTFHRTRDGVARPPVQASTHNHYVTRLKAFFEFCTKRGYIRTDLLADVDRMEEPKKRRQQPGPALLLQLLDQAEHARDRAYIAVALNSALRANEIARILVGDVDLDGEWINVWITKSKIQTTMPITADLDPELRRWMTQYAEDIGRPLMPTDYLLPARSSKHRPPQRVNGTFQSYKPKPEWVPEKPIAKTAGIVKHALAGVGLPTEHEGTHTIRRAVARAYFEKVVAETGYDGALRMTSALLHHAHASTTEHYLGLDNERRRRDEMMRGKPFLTSMVNTSNVVPLRPVAGDGDPS